MSEEQLVLVAVFWVHSLSHFTLFLTSMGYELATDFRLAFCSSSHCIYMVSFGGGYRWELMVALCVYVKFMFIDLSSPLMLHGVSLPAVP